MSMVWGIAERITNAGLWLAKYLAKWRILFSCLLLAAALGLIAAAGPLYSAIATASPAVKRIGKELGSAAQAVSLLALPYYLLRELAVRRFRSGFSVMREADTLLKSWLTILRQAHPVLGVLALALAAMHTYFFLVLQPRFGQTPFYSGLPVMLFLIALGVTGFYLPFSTGRSARRTHRLLAAGFILVLFLHNAFH